MTSLLKIEPTEIEAESFRIIEKEFFEQTGHRPEDYPNKEFVIMRRVIHATGDFSFSQSLCFTKDAVEAGINSIKNGKSIITDVNMAKAGISKNIAARFGCEILCRIGEQSIAEKAKINGVTRAETALAMAADDNCGILAIGNAPTALVKAMELIESGVIKPDLIVGVPVGFVNAAESKEILCNKSIISITSLGRKGGTPVAVAIVNAILRLADL